MAAWAFLVFALLKHVTAELNPDNELYVNFEPASGQRSSWPVARAVRMQFIRRSEEGRQYRSFEGCQILESLDEIAREAMRTPEHAVQRISKEEMELFEGRCQRMGEAKRTAWGTKWCGSGNEAANYSHLGYFSNLDSCCRTHDHCDNIPAGETKYGLKNEGKYTMMNCKCEGAFKQCLKNVTGYLEGPAAAGIRKFYFDIYGNGCYNVRCSSGGRSERSGECPNGVATYTGPTGVGAWVLNG